MPSNNFPDSHRERSVRRFRRYLAQPTVDNPHQIYVCKTVDCKRSNIGPVKNASPEERLKLRTRLTQSAGAQPPAPPPGTELTASGKHRTLDNPMGMRRKRNLEQLSDDDLCAITQSGRVAENVLAERWTEKINRMSYRGNSLSKDERRQAGENGFLKAIRTFDLTKGNFQDHATTAVDRAIKDQFRDGEGMIEVPRDMNARALKVRNAIDDLTEKLLRVPSHNELIAYTGLSEREFSNALAALEVEGIRSLDEQPEEDDSGTQYEHIEDRPELRPEITLDTLDRSLQIALALRALPFMMRRVIRLYYGFAGTKKHTLIEIARKLGKSETRIGQIHSAALIELKKRNFDL